MNIKMKINFKQLEGSGNMKDLLKQNAIAVAVASIIIVALLLAGTVRVVQSGHVGVKITLGKVSMYPLAEGLHFKLPLIQKIQQMDVRLLKASRESLAASKDLQNVTTKVEIQYSLVGALAPLIYQKIGVESQLDVKLIEPAIQESVKAVTAQYTAEHLIVKREEVKVAINQTIDNFIDKTLKDKDLDPLIKISNIAITDFRFSPEFNRAIEMKVKAEQEALQAKNEKVKRITQAEASAAEKKLAAKAEAYQIEVNSKARADAIKREANALKGNPNLIKLRATEKWDGVLPKFSGSGAIPFINIDGLGKKK